MKQGSKEKQEPLHPVHARVVALPDAPSLDVLTSTLEGCELTTYELTSKLSTLTRIAEGARVDIALIACDEVDDALVERVLLAREHESFAEALWLLALPAQRTDACVELLGSTFDDVIALPAHPKVLAARVRTWALLLSKLRAAQSRNATLYDLATTDELTGLPNRRHLLAELRREIARARRHDESMSVAMIDVDHFKRVNDHYGHAVGDAVLWALARTTSRLVRESDILGRLGGEEFVLCLPQTNEECAVMVCERLREAIEQMIVPSDKGDVRITISIGVARFDTSHDDVDELLKRADVAMYQAKQAGRNTVR